MSPEFVAYRSGPPAVLLGLNIRYWEHRHGFARPAVHLDLSRDPSYLVAAATTPVKRPA